MDLAVAQFLVGLRFGVEHPEGRLGRYFFAAAAAVVPSLTAIWTSGLLKLASEVETRGQLPVGDDAHPGIVVGLGEIDLQGPCGGDAHAADDDIELAGQQRRE